jgi:hypothetical protein
MFGRKRDNDSVENIVAKGSIYDDVQGVYCAKCEEPYEGDHCPDCAEETEEANFQNEEFKRGRGK